MTHFQSLEDIRTALTTLTAPDEGARDAAMARQATLTKPLGSLGQLEDLAVFMAGWQGRPRPQLNRPQIVIFAGNHGVCARGVNPYPQSVTAQMVANFHAGGASVNQFAKLAGTRVDIVALELERPTGDISREAAMSDADFLAAVNAGAAAVDPQADMVVFGEMGIGNSTIAAALACATFGATPADWVGPGTGSDSAGRALKASVIAEALALHAASLDDPIAIMRDLGGRELAAIVGGILAARALRIPVMLDGYICCAAAAPLTRFAGALDHCLVGHQSAEPGHARLLAGTGKTGILNLDMRLGEGSGGAVALQIVKAALVMHNGMASFTEAGVDQA